MSKEPMITFTFSGAIRRVMADSDIETNLLYSRPKAGRYLKDISLDIKRYYQTM